jgi:hypothetical protein
MAANNSELGDAFKSLAEASIDLPLLAIGRIFDRGFSDDLHRAGWKAYDAGIAVATQLTNRLYSNRRFGSISGRALDTTLKLQQLADAASGALFSALWPMLGLPTADELRRLERQWWRKIVADTFAGLGEFADFDAFFDALFAFFANPANWKPVPEAAAALSRLKARRDLEFRLPSVPNSGRAWPRSIFRFGDNLVRSWLRQAFPSSFPGSARKALRAANRSVTRR